MKIQTLAWVLTATLAMSGATVGMIACSSSDNGGGGGNDTDSGTPKMDSGHPTDAPTSTGTQDSAMPPADAGDAGCKKAPTLHPPKTDGGANLFCPFSKVPGSDAGDIYCTAPAEHCCEPTTSGSVATCDPTATPCPAMNTDWHCQSPQDCNSGQAGPQICCGHGDLPQFDAVCMDYFGSKFTGTTCETTAACPAGSFQICEQDTDCPQGMTCTPMSAKGAQFGFCK